MKGIMIQGTASDVGKSFITTAICRLLANEGIKTAPFKSQNMSNNSYVTIDGKEIGRAQGLQAEAAKTEATVWMNPILLKPRSDREAEVILFGKAVEKLSARDYRKTFYSKGLDAIKTALEKLNEDFDVIVMEGAGSPVEMNLKDKELVNMTVAELAGVPVILVADIDRGGVFASLVGTLELLTPRERNRVKGMIINKFRGDPELFADGINWLEARTGLPVLGVIPYIQQHMIEGEDSLSLADRFSTTGKGSIEIAVMKLPYLSNYSDIEPFLYEEDVTIRWVDHPENFGRPDAVIIPGTKSTISDLTDLKKQGLDAVLQNYAAEGGCVVGICGGYQMLCRTLLDEAGSDTGERNRVETGLGIIPAATVFSSEKITVRTTGKLHPHTGLSEQPVVEGYEIHLGRTELSTQSDNTAFLLLEDNHTEGYWGKNGQVIGTYMHHLFHNDEWRNVWLNRLRQQKQLPLRRPVMIGAVKDRKYDEVAAIVQPALNWERLKEIILNGV